MAKATNALTQGISGKVTGLVFRRNADGTVSIGNAPRLSSKAPTARQQEVRDNFSDAAAYGRTVQQNPALKAAYETHVSDKANSAFAVAVQDSLHAPTVRAVDFTAYHGRVGDPITVQATDDFAVAAVHVRIQHPDGTVVEEGPAAVQADQFTFRYVATAANPGLAGDTVVVEVTDRPGNLTTAQRTL